MPIDLYLRNTFVIPMCDFVIHTGGENHLDYNNHPSNVKQKTATKLTT